ncbi:MULTISPECIES: sodium:proton antiporter [unclassified Leucobacter]|uniref:cation:proton antiporter n=1 Tax=unclassified Leucobacter TaxID=2621730 RepID=UPI00165D63DE|nr:MULTISPECIES: sodium:proton antiporter [unclassified Leucobacter]MBC9937051.1 sodium:proton antiporter [Leucobacter sp. cx-87]
MEFALLAVVGLILIVGVSMLARRIGVAAPLILVVVGTLISYIPGVPAVELDPEIILLGVLPPLLYSAAVNVPIMDFRRNAGPIMGLSVVLVLLSALAVGGLLHLVVPSIPLPAAIALGAVVAPTDAVAATAIGKRLGMPPRLVTILEGESLVNDATSLVLLRTAIAATAGTFVFWDAANEFVYAVVVAILIGAVIGMVTVWLRSKLTNPIHDTAISFTVPFIAFVPTEALGASGVLAVVVAGLLSGHFATRKFTATARINERLNWRTVQFVIENGVFLVMGLQLHSIVDQIGASEVTLAHSALIAVGVVAVLILCRMGFLVPMLWSLRRTLAKYEARATGLRHFVARARDARVPEPKAERHAERVRRAERMARRTEADLTHAKSQGLDWRGALTLGWSGMRGVVTLAAAQSIPVSVPFRPQIVLIAFFVAVITLLLHGLTLPGVIRVLRPSGPSADERAAEVTSLADDLYAEGVAALEYAVERNAELVAENPQHRPLSPHVVERVRVSTHNAIAALTPSLADGEEANRDEAESETQAFLRLSRAVLDAQRAALHEERAIGEYSSEALRAAELALDAQESRLAPPAAH